MISACAKYIFEYCDSDCAEDRNLADYKLEEAAMKKITANKASKANQLTAAGVVLAMKVKNAMSHRGVRSQTKRKESTKTAKRRHKSIKKKSTKKTGTSNVKRLNRRSRVKKVYKSRVIKTPDLPAQND